MPKRLYDWKLVQEYHDLGHGYRACHKRFGFAHATWVRAIKLGKLVATYHEFRDRRRRYDWTEIQAYYDEGHTYRQCSAHFGFSAAAWHKARLRGEIRARPNSVPLEILLKTSRSRISIKRKLLRAGLLQNQCDWCGISEWRGEPLSIHIDHINGVKDDHRVENLRMLCPNCHSQTDTYGAKNRRYRRLQDPGAAV